MQRRSRHRPLRQRFACALLACAMLVAWQETSWTQAATAARARIVRADSRSLVVDAEFPALTSATADVATSDGLRTFAIAGINLTGFARELGVDASGIEILDVESVEQRVAGVALGSLDDAPLTNDTAADRERVRRLRPLAPVGPYPSAWAEISSIGELNGRAISVLRLYPYRYDAARDIVIAATRMRVRITTRSEIDQNAKAALASAFAPRARKPAHGALLSSTPAAVAPDGFEYKIYVDRDGLFRLTAAELADAGIPIESIDARTLRLYADGIEQPMFVSDRGDNRIERNDLVDEYIEFFGERRRAREREAGSDLYYDQYARYSVYFLTWGGALGKRLVDESGVIRSDRLDPIGDLTSDRSSFMSTIHLEEDHIEALLGNAELNTSSDRFDRRFWGVVHPNEFKVFDVDVPSPDLLSRRPVSVRVALRSALRNSSVLDSVGMLHDVEVFVDRFRTIEAAVPVVGLALLDNEQHQAERLTSDKLSPDGRSTITVVNRRSDRAELLSDVNVNWIDVTYPRSYVAREDSIEFSCPPGLGSRYVTFRVRGFGSPNIRVYRKGISRLSNVTVVGSASGSASLESGDSTFDVMFQAYVASEHEKFFAVTDERVMRPVIARDRAADLLASTNAADFIMIVDETTSRVEAIDEASHALQRYAAFKSRNGFTPRIVRAADIYDAFNGGVVSPLAIKRFLAHAYRTWSVAPRYALIFSRGYPTPVDGLAPNVLGLGPILSERSYVPSIMMQTVLYGATECDYLLGCIDGRAEVQTNLYEGARKVVTDDLIAEVIVGRVAVNAYADIEVYVDKVIEQYESPSTDDDWRYRSLMIGGWEELQGQQLMSLSNDFARHVSEPHRYIASREFVGSRYELGKGRSIMSTMASGVGLVTYLGHGGGGQWESSTELLIPTAQSLANRGRMAPVLSLTCFTGAYSVDGCLIGKLMVSPNGGAIQALGTPGFGWLRNNGFFGEALYSVMHNTRYRHLSFGEIVTLGKALYIGTHSKAFPDYVPTVAAMFAVFGDPSLPMPYAHDTTTLSATQSIAVPGGTIDGAATLAFAPTRVTATLFDTTEVAIPGASATARVEGSRVIVSGSLPGDYSQAYAGIRLNASGAAGERVSGALRIPTSGASTSMVRPVGRLLAGTDAIFEIEHHSAAALTGVEAGVRYASGAGGFAAAPLSVSTTGAALYRTAPIAGSELLPGAIIDLVLPATTAGGSRAHTFHVEGGADPSAFAEAPTDSARQRYGPRASYDVGAAINASIAMSPTASGARLALPAHNWGDRDAVAVPYVVSYDSSQTRVIVATGTLSIPARGTATVHADMSGRYPVARRVTLRLEPDTSDRWADAFLRNNEAYNVTPIAGGLIRSGIGFTSDGATAAPYAVADVFAMSVDASTARRDVLVTAQLDSSAPATGQSWTVLATGAGSWRGQALRIVAPGAETSMRISLTLHAPSTSVLDDARIVGYDSTTRLWISYPSSRDAQTLTAQVPPTGLYAIARMVDETGPRITFAVDGQFYLDSAAVARDARFSAVVFDESGIDPDKFSATLDGIALEVGRDVVWLDSTITPTSAGLRVQKQAEVGSHTLCVTAADRVGNVATECTSFQVDGELSLRMYGNFPNPFSSETFIAYEIRGTSVVDAVEVKIFSTAGRLVRTFRFPTASAGETRGLFTGGTGEPTAIGYHEVWWDGRDDAGREVANGVYFYRVRVELDGEEIEEIGTLARIR